MVASLIQVGNKYDFIPRPNIMAKIFHVKTHLGNKAAQTRIMEKEEAKQNFCTILNILQFLGDYEQIKFH